MARTIGIIGGGPAGLALADDLCQAGFAVTLFEAAEELGGLARSFEFGDIRIERYYHFICSGDTGYFRKLSELGLTSTLRWRPTRMGFFYRGRLYPFSSAADLLRFDGISLAARLRYGFLALRCSLLTRWQPLDAIPAESWLKKALGTPAYMATWYPLLRVKFDRFHDQISAAWVWHRMHRVARSRRTPLHQERLGFLTGGTDRLVAALEARLGERGARLATGQAVRRIVIEGGRATGVETADGARWPFDAVVSAVPLPHFVRMAPELPADYRAALSAIDFIGVICVTFRLRYRLSENFWLNVNDERVPFNGCIEYTNLNPEVTPDGSAIVYIPFYLPRDHERFGYDDSRLIADCVHALGILNPRFRPDWVLHAVVSRDPYAQVICASGFAARVPPHRTPIENLFLIDSSQLYPADRTISGTIDLARAVATLLKRRLAGRGGGVSAEGVACPLCGSAEVFRRFASPVGEPMSATAESFGSSRPSVQSIGVLACRACGAGWQDPPPPPETVAAAYRDMQDDLYLAEERLRRRSLGRAVALLERWSGGRHGRLLDVGCSAGLFSELARDAGWKVQGIEPSRWLADRARERLGDAGDTGDDAVLCARLEDVALPAGSFDAVCLWDVLEHVADPDAFLARAVAALRPGGLLALNVPNLQSVIARALGRRWPLLLPEHLFFFSPASLRLLFRRHGLAAPKLYLHPVFFGAGFVARRLAQHGVPGSRLLARALGAGPLQRLPLPLLMGELTAVGRKEGDAGSAD